MTSAPKASRRSPNGVVSAKPIPMRLLPEERAEVQEWAAKEDRSLASVCRLMFLRGKAECERTNKLIA